MGQVLDDRYEVVQKLARGGMSTVYLANDLRLSRTVAVKIMNEGLGDAEDFASRFDAEARAAAHLSHHNVVSVFDQGTDGGRPYIVMEHIAGWTLRQIITREAPMDPRRVLDLLEPVAAALATAHAAGIIHRDVKPENVLVSDRGLVKVADFGLARAVNAQAPTGTTGLVLGTVSYIAPELVTRGSADARSDVYSLGIVMYEMLTGRKPHTGDEPIQVAYSHVHNQIPAPSMELSTSWREGGIPPYVDALVTTAANRDRPHRPADAGVFLAHLRAARDALARGVTDDPDLTALMRRTTLPDTDHEPTTVVPLTADAASTPADAGPDVSGTVLPTRISNHTRALPVEAEPRRRRRRPRAALVVALIAALAVLVGGGWTTWYMVEGRWVPTPALASMTQTEAQAAAQDVGVGVVFEREYSEDVPLGQVIRTDPEAETRMLRDDVITAYVSLGPERYAVPELVGISLEQATTALTNTHLQVGEVTEKYHDSTPAGEVMAQGFDPEEEVKRDTAVDLTVSRGPAPVKAKDFTEKSLSALKTWAEKNAITVATSEQHHDSIPAGSVISQEPVEGTLHRGDTVTAVVSKGPVMVAIPTGLRGKGAANVKKQLEDLGFTTKYNRLVNGPFGIVLRLDPREGTEAPKGSLITIHVV
ncbi:MAG: Stk1 family PASTA domain-containing Ser/Thr kinase [Propioniciclava sp.]